MKFKTFFKAILVFILFNIFCIPARADYRDQVMDDQLKRVEMEDGISPLNLQDYITRNEAQPALKSGSRTFADDVGLLDSINKGLGLKGAASSSQAPKAGREEIVNSAFDSGAQTAQASEAKTAAGSQSQPQPQPKGEAKVVPYADEVGILDPLKKVSVPSKVRFAGQATFPDERYKAYVDYILPLYYPDSGNTLLFFNPKNSCDMTGSARELNMGLGLRHIFFDSFILGGHIFYDKKLSINNQWHSQLGYGFEFLSKPFDFRFNYYDPITKPKLVDDGYDFS